MRLGIKPFDALHLACASLPALISLITTDDALLRKLRDYSDLMALPPGAALAPVEHWYEN